MREMFIEKGFNDYLAKPIDVSKLDETLDRWIPKEKRAMKNNNNDLESANTPNSLLPTPYSQLPIPGLDMAKGIVMTGGTMDAYRQVLSIFREDAQERLPLLQNTPTVDALPAFVTQVHALKSASASIGAAELSAQAAALEAAGKTGNLAFIQDNLPVFTEHLAKLATGIQVWEKTLKEHDSEKSVSANKPDHAKALPLLQELASALKLQKADDIDRILEHLMSQQLDDIAKTALEQISNEVLMAEYDNAGEILDSLLKGVNNS
jgi:HPt (histidine-containing phosphotransfer) domain-containing protein